MSIRSPAFGSLALTVAATASQLKATPKAPADTPIRVNWPMLFVPITFGGLITNWQGYDMKWEYVVMKRYFFYDHVDLFQQVFHEAFNNSLKLQYQLKLMGSCIMLHTEGYPRFVTQFHLSIESVTSCFWTCSLSSRIGIAGTVRHIHLCNPISYQPCRITKFCIFTILYHHKPTSYNPLSYQSCIITNLYHINYITLTLKLSCRPGFVLGSLFQTWLLKSITGSGEKTSYPQQK